MNAIEINQIYLEYVHAINGLWEIWLASTFAFIVAFHVGSSSLTRVLTWIGCALYFAASTALILRYLIYVNSMRVWRERIIESEFAIPIVDVSYGSIAFPLTIGTLTIGTVVALGFAIYQYRASNDT